MHGYFLLLNNAKMAKSAGEFLRMKSLTDRGYDPLTYRFLCLTAHYRTQMSFSWDAMDAAQTGLDRLRRQVFELGPAGAADPAFVDRFRAEVNDDLQFPKALALLGSASITVRLGEKVAAGLRRQPGTAAAEAADGRHPCRGASAGWQRARRIRVRSPGDAIAARGFAVEDSAAVMLVKKTSA
jgi:cysteinyl-tRNA synthetase